jgi:PKD repeat protein
MRRFKISTRDILALSLTLGGVILFLPISLAVPTITGRDLPSALAAVQGFDLVCDDGAGCFSYNGYWNPPSNPNQYCKYAGDMRFGYACWISSDCQPNNDNYSVFWRPYQVSGFIPGKYEVFAYIPRCDSATPHTQSAKYYLRRAGDSAASAPLMATVNQAHPYQDNNDCSDSARWASLGTHYFDSGTYVELRAWTDESGPQWGTRHHLIFADAVKFSFRNQPPNIPNLVAPGNGSTTDNPSVTLKVQDAGDPDNYPRNYRDYYYRIEKTDGSWSQEWGWTTDTSWTVEVPSTGTYRWRVRAGDGELASGWANWWTLGYNASPPPPSQGFLTFPIGLSPSQAPVSAWFDTYYDQADRNGGLISEYNGIEGYNRMSTAYTGPGYCSRNPPPYFYPGYVTDYRHSNPWYYRCGWTFGNAYNRHGGTDYAVSGANVPIRAAAPGTVVWASGSLIIQHSNNTRTFYGHIRQIGRFNSQCQRVGNLYVSSRVGRGEIVACGTDSANHLHFGVKLNASRVPWHDANPANHAPIVDPYTHNLWLGGPPASNVLLPNWAVAPPDNPPTYDNLTPIGLFSIAPSYARVGKEVSFDASDSYDEDGDITGFEWDFGDSITTTGRIVTHTYTTPGTYYVELTVYDDEDGLGYAEGWPVVVFNDTPALVEAERAFHTWPILTATQVTLNLAQTPQARFELSWSTGDADLSLTDPLGRLITVGTTISGVVVETSPNRLAFVLSDAPTGEYVLRSEAQGGAATDVQLRTSVVDVTPPAEASVRVEVDKVTSQVHLTLAVTDTESAVGMEMRYALNEASFGDWQPFTSTVQIPWGAEEGPDGAVVQFRDSNGNLSPLFDGTTFHTWLAHDQSPVLVFLPLVIRGH